MQLVEAGQDDFWDTVRVTIARRLSANGNLPEFLILVFTNTIPGS